MTHKLDAVISERNSTRFTEKLATVDVLFIGMDRKFSHGWEFKSLENTLVARDIGIAF